MQKTFIFTVCNVCEDPERQVRQYTISSEGLTETVDLCEEHDAPFRRFLEPSAPRVKPAAPVRKEPERSAEKPVRKRGRSIQVVNPDEIPREG